MSEIKYANLKNNAKAAAKIWDEFVSTIEDKEEFVRLFHLRPTSHKTNFVTIVSTIEGREMKGIKVNRTNLKKELEKLHGLMNSDFTMEHKIDKLNQYGFQHENTAMVEKKHQVHMIKDMERNDTLKEYLGVDKLIFIASEFILHNAQDNSKRERIDIIGYDGVSRLFFFELKDPAKDRGKYVKQAPKHKEDPVEQVRKYIEVYGGEKRQDMGEVLKNYPINSVNLDNFTIEGCALYGYGEKVDVSKSETVSFEEQSVKVIRFLDNI